MNSLFPFASGALFSDCQRYRYGLWRMWDPTKPVCMFIMLNPSTADETKNDPTVERCQRRALEMGYGALRVANIFAWRSTDPKGLLHTDDPIGPGNDFAIRQAAIRSDMIICGWGRHGSLHDRGPRVLQMLKSYGRKPYALKINGDGSPGHPLYVGYHVLPKPLLSIL